MYLLFFVIPLVLLIPVFVYMFFWFRRLFSLFSGIPVQTGKILAVVLALLCAYLSWPMYRMGGMVMIHFLVAGIVIDLIYRIVRKVRKEIPERWDMVYRSGMIPVVIVLAMMIYGYINMHQVRETHYEITSDAVEGSLRIAAISDLHLGTNMDAEELSGYCDKIESKGPDIFVLVGDIFDENTKKEEMRRAAEIFGSVGSTYGTYYVLGNHDPNHYREKQEYSEEELCETMEEAGVTVMRDSVVSLEGLTVIGRQDASREGRKSTEELAAEADGGKFTLLIDHQPLGLSKNADTGVNLQISGHTHAGQIWPTGVLMQLMGVSELNYGYKKIGNMNMIVTSGIGGWGYPVRTGRHCEYLIVDVHA